MSELDRLYARLLQVGFVVLNQALQSGNRDWVRAEIELLHNIPSLLGEDNIERHQFFWTGERQHYLDWLSQHGAAEARSRMRTFYEPLWNEMEPLIAQLSQVGSN
ncbi:MAG: hypothetical protein WD894_22975 [Pirellulales bacterium]